jgi:hypothetical protein
MVQRYFIYCRLSHGRICVTSLRSSKLYIVERLRWSRLPLHSGVVWNNFKMNGSYQGSFHFPGYIANNYCGVINRHASCYELRRKQIDAFVIYSLSENRFYLIPKTQSQLTCYINGSTIRLSHNYNRGRKSRDLLIQLSMQVSDNINVWHTSV